MALPIPTFLFDVIDRDGMVAIDRLSRELRITKLQLASASGLSRDAVSKTTRLKGRSTQARLREMTEIINRVLPWAASVPQDCDWSREQQLPGFGNQKVEAML